MSYTSALDLADVFQMEVQFWINLQAAYNLWHARKQHQSKPALSQRSA